MFLPHWDFLPSPLGKDCSSLYYWGRNFLPFPTAEGVFFTSPLWMGKEFSSLYYWGKNFLPFRTTEGVFFTSPLWMGKEFSSLHYWGRNFLPFITGEGIFFPSYWGRNFLPFISNEGKNWYNTYSENKFMVLLPVCYHSSNIMIFKGDFYGYNSIMQQ